MKKPLPDKLPELRPITDRLLAEAELNGIHTDFSLTEVSQVLDYLGLPEIAARLYAAKEELVTAVARAYEALKELD